MVREFGGLGKSFKALSVFVVRLLSMLKCEASKVTEDDLEATGFLGIEKVLDVRRRSMGSDLDLIRAGAGRSRTDISSYTSFTKSSQHVGNSGSSLPGRYMLNCRGRNAGARRTGDMRPDCTFLKSDGAPMVGRRVVLLLEEKLRRLKGRLVLEDMERRERRSVLVVDGRWEVKGRGKECWRREHSEAERWS